MRLLLAFALLIVAANAAKTFNQITAEVAGGHWNYHTEGDDWHGTCHSGKRQSPIDINTEDVVVRNEGSSKARSLKLTFKYRSAVRPQIINNGHTLQVNANKKKRLGEVKANGEQYVVRQFHFHAPSEHTVDGKRFAAELHIVHQLKGSTGTDDLLVVGILIETGLHNKFLGTLEWEIAPEKAGKSRNIEGAVDLRDLGNVLDSDYYGYDGSLTTPTCDETVTWRVLTNSITATERQIAVLKDKFKGNGRKTQPLHGRKVFLFKRKDDDNNDF